MNYVMYRLQKNPKCKHWKKKLKIVNRETGEREREGAVWSSEVDSELQREQKYPQQAFSKYFSSSMKEKFNFSKF